MRKLGEGTQGLGVVLAETDKAAISVVEAFESLKTRVILQEFIKEAGGADRRAVVDGKDGVIKGRLALLIEDEAILRESIKSSNRVPNYTLLPIIPQKVTEEERSVTLGSAGVSAGIVRVEAMRRLPLGALASSPASYEGGAFEGSGRHRSS